MRQNHQPTNKNLADYIRHPQKQKTEDCLLLDSTTYNRLVNKLQLRRDTIV